MATTFGEFSRPLSGSLNFKLRYADFKKAYEIARLAGDYTNIYVLIQGKKLSLMSAVEGITCISSCAIELAKTTEAEVALAFETDRTLFQALASKNLLWEHVSCQVNFEPSKPQDDKPSSPARATWTLSSEDIHITWPFDIIPMPEMPVSEVGLDRSITCQELSRVLRMLKPFTDPESKKSQFISAQVENGRASAGNGESIRLVRQETLQAPTMSIGSRQISDFAHVLQRVSSDAIVIDGEDHILLQDEISRLTVKKETARANHSDISDDSPCQSLTVDVHALNNALAKMLSQTNLREPVLAMYLEPNEGNLVLSTDVPGGQAHISLPVKADIEHEPVGMLFKASLLKILLIPTCGADVKLCFFKKFLMAEQSDSGILVKTYITAQRRAAVYTAHGI
jgi:hypothetical protein